MPGLKRRPSYDPIGDFTAVAALGYFPNVLAVNPALPVRSVRELIALARKRPGELTFASNGNGTSNHLAGEMLKSHARIDLLHVPYKGGAPAIADVVAGHVTMLFNGVANVLPFERTGKLRALAVASGRRSPTLPAVPTMGEAGLPGFEADVWVGLFAPARLPPDIAEHIAGSARSALQAPPVQTLLGAQGAEVVAGTPAEFAALVRSEVIRWRKVVQAAGLPLE